MCASRVVAGDSKFEYATQEVKSAFNSYLRKTTKQYDLASNVKVRVNSSILSYTFVLCCASDWPYVHGVIYSVV